MKTRRAAVKYIQNQLSGKVEMRGECFHYGKEALRQLLDFIYEGEPRNKLEKLLTCNIVIERERLKAEKQYYKPIRG